MNDAVRKKHNEPMVKRREEAKRYSKSLATRGFDLEEIIKRVGKTYRCHVAEWTQNERTRYLRKHV